MTSFCEQFVSENGAFSYTQKMLFADEIHFVEKMGVLSKDAHLIFIEEITSVRYQDKSAPTANVIRKRAPS